MSEDNVRVSAKANLSSTWIDTENATHQATRRDVTIGVKTGYMTQSDSISIEMWSTDDKPHVLNLWRFDDIDELEALADLIKKRVEEYRKDKEMGLIE